MARALALVPVLLAVVLSILLLGSGGDVEEGARSTGRAPAESQSAAAQPSSAPSATRPAPVSRPRRLADVPRFRVSPHRGVRAVVGSPRVTLPDGNPGVDPKGWEATVYALVPSPERHAVDRIAILKRTAPSSPRGDFEIDLPVGRHLLLVQHRVAEAGGSAVLEAWYGYVDVAQSMTVPIDLGRHTFDANAMRGVLLSACGAPGAALTVECSDEVLEPGEALVRGVHLVAVTGPDGRFAFSLARADGADRVARVFATLDGAFARREGVRPGDFVELVLEKPLPEADVVFEIPWSSGMTFWIYSEERRIAFMREAGKAPAGGTLEERRSVPLGRYVVEMFRDGEGSRDEWAREELVVAEPGPCRFRVEPRFRPARTITGRVQGGAAVSWITRVADGSTFVRMTARAGEDGGFTLSGLPTTAVLLRAGTKVTSVPEGAVGLVDVGELE